MTQCMTQAINIKDRFLLTSILARQWWCRPIILGGRVSWISEFEASLFYTVISRRTSAIQKNPVSKQKQKQKQKTKNKKQTKNPRVLFMDKCLEQAKKKLPSTDDRYQTTPGEKPETQGNHC